MKRPTSARISIAAKAIGDSLNTWRRLQGLTMEQLAQKANVSRGTLSRLEHGDPSVSLETFLGVCSAVGITDRITEAVDPFETEFGRLRAEQRLAKRIRR